MKKVWKVIVRLGWLLLPTGFVLGMVGYMCIGDLNFIEALYATGALFFVNPVSEIEHPLIMTSKIIALAATAGFIVSAINSVSVALKHFWVRQWQDSTAVYTDNDWGRKLVHKLKHGYQGAEDGLENVRCHIIMFSDDVANLKFYQEHYTELMDCEVYIMLNRVNAFLMDRPDMISARVHFFNLYDLMARLYWQEHSLFDTVKKRNEPVRVAIIGYGNAGESICKYAILNNLYAVNQRIEYHLWGCSKRQGEVLSGIDLMNQDRIVIHEGEIYDGLDELASMDRIILTEENSIGMLQELLLSLETRDVDGEILPSIHYCFGETVIEQLFDAKNLVTFGDMENILTEECIKGERLQRMAKLFNYDYHVNFSVPGGLPQKDSKTFTPQMEAEMERIWNGLDGFLRGSNIARADHYWIEKRLQREGVSEIDMQNIEHSRWSRYHTFNRWTCAADGKKDRRRRKHPLLVPFSELNHVEQSKDSVTSDCIRAEIDKLLENMFFGKK